MVTNAHFLIFIYIFVISALFCVVSKTISAYESRLAHVNDMENVTISCGTWPQWLFVRPFHFCLCDEYHNIVLVQNVGKIVGIFFFWKLLPYEILTKRLNC